MVSSDLFPANRNGDLGGWGSASVRRYLIHEQETPTHEEEREMTRSSRRKKVERSGGIATLCYAPCELICALSAGTGKKKVVPHHSWDIWIRIKFTIHLCSDAIWTSWDSLSRSRWNVDKKRHWDTSYASNLNELNTLSLFLVSFF